MSLGSGRCLFVFLVGLWAGIIGGGIILAILIPNLGDAAFVVTVPFSLAVVVMLLAAFWYGLEVPPVAVPLPMLDPEPSVVPGVGAS